MYRKETLMTDGEKRLVIVCDNGMGLSNFKIFAQKDNYIDVGYSLAPVRTNTIITYSADTYEEVKFSQTYYVLDLEQKKLFRAACIGVNAKFPMQRKKNAVLFDVWSDVQIKLEKKNDEYVVRAYDEEGDNVQAAVSYRWVDEEEMPGNIHIVDFKNEVVHDVQSVIFLD